MLEKLKALWNEHKLLIIPVILLALLVWFRDIIIDFLVASANRQVDKTKEQSNELKAKEDAANTQANQIIANADKKSENKPTVDENWDRKK